MFAYMMQLQRLIQPAVQHVGVGQPVVSCKHSFRKSHSATQFYNIKMTILIYQYTNQLQLGNYRY